MINWITKRITGLVGKILPAPVAKVVWIGGKLQRFYNLQKGQIASFEEGLPQLVYQSGALRDPRGRYVPWEMIGGDVVKTYAVGRGQDTNVVRRIPTPEIGQELREFERYTVVFDFEYEGKEYTDVTVSFSQGEAFTVEGLDERMHARIAQKHTGISDPRQVMMTDVEITGMEFHVITQYESGTKWKAEEWGRW